MKCLNVTKWNEQKFSPNFQSNFLYKADRKESDEAGMKIIPILQNTNTTKHPVGEMKKLIGAYIEVKRG